MIDLKTAGIVAAVFLTGIVTGLLIDFFRNPKPQGIYEWGSQKEAPPTVVREPGEKPWDDDLTALLDSTREDRDGEAR